MKQVSELSKGDKIYDVSFGQIKRYTYLCVHPNSEKYHILINASEEPSRIYVETLQDILNMGLVTYEDAKLFLANELEEMAKALRRCSTPKQ